MIAPAHVANSNPRSLNMSIPRPALLDALRDFFGPDAPIVAKAIATNEAKAEADRRAHGDAIAELERERDAKLPGLRAAHDKAVAARKALEEKLQAAHAAERAAFAAQRAFSFTTENDLATHRLALTETADPRIAGLAADIRSLQQRLRANGYTTDTEPGWVGLRQVNMAKGSNYEAINRRFAQCLDALRAE